MFNFLFCICCDFFRTALFSEKLPLHTSSEQLLRHNSYFFGAAVSGNLLFFDELLFQNNHFFAAAIFFRIVTFPEWSFYQAATTWVQDVLYGSYFSEQLSFWRKNCLDWRYLQKSYFFEAVTSAKHQLFQKSYILEKKRIFQKINMRHYTFFSGGLTF